MSGVRGRTLSEKLADLPAVRRQKIEQRAADLISEELAVRGSAQAELRADVDAGWKDIDERRVSDLDTAAIKQRGRVRLSRTKGGK